MAMKLLLCAVLAMVVCQNVNARTASLEQRDDGIRLAVDKATRVVYDLKVVVEALGQDTNQHISNLLDAFNTQSRKLLEEANSRINGIQMHIYYWNLDIVRAAADCGADSAYCVAVKEVKVQQLMKDTSSNMDACTDMTRKTEADRLVTEVTHWIHEGLETANALERKIEECLQLSVDSEVISCLTYGTNNAKLEAARLSVIIGEAAKEGDKWASHASTDISVCVAMIFWQTEAPAAQISSDLLFCVVDKIHAVRATKEALQHTGVVPSN